MRVPHNPRRSWSAEQFFGEQVKVHRELRGWTQEALAQRLRELMGVDLHQTAITRIERGQRAVRLNEFAALAQLLDLDTSVYRGHGRPLNEEDYSAAKARAAELESQVEQARRELEATRTEFFEKQKGQEIRLQLLSSELSALESSIYSYEHRDELTEWRRRVEAGEQPFAEGGDT